MHNNPVALEQLLLNPLIKVYIYNRCTYIYFSTGYIITYSSQALFPGTLVWRLPWHFLMDKEHVAWNYFNPWIWVGNGDKLHQKVWRLWSMPIYSNLNAVRGTVQRGKPLQRPNSEMEAIPLRKVFARGLFPAQILAMISRKAFEHVFFCPSAELDCWKATPAKRRKLQDWEVNLKH